MGNREVTKPDTIKQLNTLFVLALSFTSFEDDYIIDTNTTSQINLLNKKDNSEYEVHIVKIK